MLLTNANIATLDGDLPYGMIPNGAIAIRNATIKWIGDIKHIPPAFVDGEPLDLEGALVTPGLIDCHTHLVHGGNRAKEFELRLQGASYEEIAKAGGGIVSTVKQTRLASFEQLLASALERADHLIAEGMTTLEIKSGYGLDIETELKMLGVAREIGKRRPVEVVTSFLGAHAVPQEFAGRPDAYIEEVCLPALREAHREGLVDAVDGFCETIAFSPEQIRKVFDYASKLSLPVKLHAEQLSNLGGSKLASQYNALSADHLEYLDIEGVRAMAHSGSVAVLLPGAFYTLRESQLPPIDALREHKVPIAIATDCNPGSSPITSLLLAMNMGCALFRMTPEETLTGVTKNAARALGFIDRGKISPGMQADLCIWDAEHPSELSYRMGFNPLKKRIFKGEIQ